jgi:hypothetical protein
VDLGEVILEEGADIGLAELRICLSDLLFFDLAELSALAGFIVVDGPAVAVLSDVIHDVWG